MPREFGQYQDFLGIPYSDADRGRDGTNCYDLGRLIYREALGVELEDYGPAKAWHENAARIRAGLQVGPWIDVTGKKRQPFDFVVYAIGRIDDHMGVVVTGPWMIHVQRGDLSRLDPIAEGRFGRLSGVWRHQALA